MIYFINKDREEVIAQSFEDDNPIIPVVGDVITLKSNNWVVTKCTIVYEDTEGTDFHVSYKTLYICLKKIKENE